MRFIICKNNQRKKHTSGVKSQSAINFGEIVDSTTNAFGDIYFDEEREFGLINMSSNDIWYQNNDENEIESDSDDGSDSRSLGNIDTDARTLKFEATDEDAKF